MEWSVDPELGDCVICTDAMDSKVLCCSRSPTWFVLLDVSLHVWCISFCNQSLAVFARSSSFMVSSLFHGCMIDFDLLPSNQGLNSLVSQLDSNPIRWQFSVVVAFTLLPSSDMIPL